MAILTAREVANMLRCSPDHVRSLARRNLIPTIRLGGVYRFRDTDLDAWMAVQCANVKTTSAVPTDSETQEQVGAGHMVRRVGRVRQTAGWHRTEEAPISSGRYLRNSLARRGPTQAESNTSRGAGAERAGSDRSQLHQGRVVATENTAMEPDHE